MAKIINEFPENVIIIYAETSIHGGRASIKIKYPQDRRFSSWHDLSFSRADAIELGEKLIQLANDPVFESITPEA